MHFRNMLEQLQKMLVLTHRIQVSMVQYFDLKKGDAIQFVKLGHLELPLLNESRVITKNNQNLLRYLETTISMLREIEIVANTIQVAVINFESKVKKNKNSNLMYIDTTI